MSDVKQYLVGFGAGCLVGALGVLAFVPEASTPPEPQPAFQPAVAKVVEQVQAKPCPPASPVSPSASACSVRLREALKRARTTRKEGATSEDVAADQQLIQALMDELERSGGVGPDGVPTPWPKEATGPLSRAEFPKIVARLQEACPEVFPKETQARCEEYPCFIAMPAGDSGQAWKGHARCPLYLKTFGDSASMMVSETRAPDGTPLRGRILRPMPGKGPLREYDRAYQGNMLKRKQLRLRQYMEELLRGGK